MVRIQAACIHTLLSLAARFLQNAKESIIMYMAVIVLMLSTYLPVYGIARSSEIFGWVSLVTYLHKTDGTGSTLKSTCVHTIGTNRYHPGQAPKEVLPRCFKLKKGTAPKVHRADTTSADLPADLKLCKMQKNACISNKCMDDHV